MDKCQNLIRLHQYVIRFDICVHDVDFLEETQCEEKLVSVRSHGLDVQADILPKPFHHISEIHARGILSIIRKQDQQHRPTS